MTENQKRIYHLAVESDFRTLAKGNVYLPTLYEQDGFVHCTGEPETLLTVANDYFARVEEPVLALVIEVARLTAEVKFEPPAPITGGGVSHMREGLLFPHIYGPLNVDAVEGVGVLTKEAGQFGWPEEFVGVEKFLND